MNKTAPPLSHIKAPRANSRLAITLDILSPKPLK